MQCRIPFMERLKTRAVHFRGNSTLLLTLCECLYPHCHTEKCLTSKVVKYSKQTPCGPLKGLTQKDLNAMNPNSKTLWMCAESTSLPQHKHLVKSQPWKVAAICHETAHGTWNKVIQTQALFRGESRDRDRETCRGQNQVSNPDQKTYHAGIRQTERPDTGRKSRNRETRKYSKTLRKQETVTLTIRVH